MRRRITTETYVEVRRQLFPDVRRDLVGGEEEVELRVGRERHYSWKRVLGQAMSRERRARTLWRANGEERRRGGGEDPA